MEETLRQLGGILLRAVPTFIFVVLLHLYLKYIFFKPLERVLRERYDATEGARKLAEESIARAAQKADEYEAAIGADVLVFMTEWNQFRALNMERIRGLMKVPRIADLRNIYEPADMRAMGFQYVGVGR